VRTGLGEPFVNGVDQVMGLVQIGPQSADFAAITGRRSPHSPLRVFQALRHAFHVPPQLSKKVLSLRDVGKVRRVSHATDRATCVLAPLIEENLDDRSGAADSEQVVGISEEVMMAEVLARLGAAYPDSSADDVQGCVRRAQGHFQASPIREFVPLLVERRARAELSRPVVDA
jgi:hypothetical protein